MFTAAELADMRAEQAAAMPFTCVVTTPGVETDNAYGGTTPGVATTESVACRVGVPNANDQVIADRLSVRVSDILTLPYGTAVSPRGAIAVTETGKDYDVTYVNTEQSYQTAVRVFCTSIRSES